MINISRSQSNSRQSLGIRQLSSACWRSIIIVVHIIAVDSEDVSKFMHLNKKIIYHCHDVLLDYISFCKIGYEVIGVECNSSV